MNIKIQLNKTFLILALIIALVMPVFVSAQTNAGIKPSSIFYFFDTTFEKIGLFFTFGPEAKARKALEHAEERLAEIQEEKESESIKTALDNYESNIALATQKSGEVEDKERVETLLTTVADSTEKHQEILSVILTNVPKEAREVIIQAIEMSRKKQEEILERVTELKKEVEQLKEVLGELKEKNEVQEKIIEELKQQEFKSAVQKIEPQSQNKEEDSIISSSKKQIGELIQKEETEENMGDSVPTEEIQSQPETTVKNEILILTNKIGISYRYYNPSISKQRIQNLIDVGFKVTSGELPEGIVTDTDGAEDNPSDTPPPTKILEISSVNITPTLNSVHFEWETGVPAESKIFLSGGDLSSKVYQSESGLSTRHIVNITKLTSGMEYSYDIEAIANDKVIKNQGAFATIADEYEILIQSDKPAVYASGFHNIKFTIKAYKNGEIMGGQEVSMVTPDSSQNDSQITGDTTSSQYWYTNFYYVPKTVGSHTIDFSWSVVSGGVSKIIKKSIDVYGTPYTKIDPTFVSYPVEVIYPVGYQNATIVSFRLSEDDEPLVRMKFGDIKYETNIEDQNLLRFATPYDGGANFTDRSTIRISNTKSLLGVYTLTIKEISVRGKLSGEIRQVSGLPVTFTFEVK